MFANDFGALEVRDLAERRIRNQQNGHLRYRIERLWSRLAPGGGPEPVMLVETGAGTVVVDTTTDETIARDDIETVLRRHAATRRRDPIPNRTDHGTEPCEDEPF